MKSIIGYGMLDTLATAALISAEYEVEKATYHVDDTTFFLRLMSSIIDDGFQQATPSAPNIDITAPAGTLMFEAVGDSGMAAEIGTKCAAYWAAAITPTGTPVSCSSIASVSNDAAKIADVISSGLMALTGSTEPLVPAYYDFVDVIYGAVQTIVWTITETGAECNATLSATVS